MSYLVRIYDRATDADRQVGPGLTLGEALHAAYVLLPVAPHSRLMVRMGAVSALSLVLLLRLADGGINVIGRPDPSIVGRAIVGRAIDDELARLAAAEERLAWTLAHAETALALAATHAGLARPPVGRLTTRTTAAPGVGWRAHLADTRGPVITTDPYATERRAVEALTRTLAHLWPERSAGDRRPS